jgi:uncharacterized tellurite resistance protein B-like protein
MTAEDIHEMTDEEVNEEERIGLRALNSVLTALPQRKRLELISVMWEQAFDRMAEDPTAMARFIQLCHDNGYAHELSE